MISRFTDGPGQSNCEEKPREEGGFVRGFRGEFETFAFLLAVRPGKRWMYSLPSFFHLFSPARRRSKAWKRRPHRPIERFHASPVGAAKMSRRPAIVCYARIVDFFFPPVLFPWPGGLRGSFPTHPRFFPFPRLYFALLFRRRTGWWRRVAPSAHFLPINLAACGNGRHADDRDSSR